MDLINYKNYHMYQDMVRTGEQKTIYVPQDITLNNIADHIEAILNILKDGIATDFVKHCMIIVSWGGDTWCELSLVDYWYNLFMWSMLLKTNQEIKPKHIFWSAELRRGNIKSFIDKYILSKHNRITIDSYELNSIICDNIWYFSHIEEFSYWLANTINNEDDIDLAKKSSRFNELLHCSMQGVPFEMVKEKGMEITYEAVDIIKDSEELLGYEHCLTNSFRANEAVNLRQYKEVNFNIGTKPNNKQGIHPYVIDKSYKMGGVNNLTSYFIESSTARIAQILSKNNVGDSGDFARLLGINNTDTILHNNADYHCMSTHYIKYEVKSDKHLNIIKNRYFRFMPNGLDYLVDIDDKSIIGKTIYLHSPITCASKSAGIGICSRCYGDLYYTNRDINIGKIAAEILSSQLTQTLLSAKHLLETKIRIIEWLGQFNDFFSVDINTIKLNTDLEPEELKKYFIQIDPEDVQLENEDDFSNYEDDNNDSVTHYNEYIEKFSIVTPMGEELVITSKENNPLYISIDFNRLIRKKAYNVNDKITIPMNVLDDIDIFFIKINNNEISKTMNDIIDVINKSSVTPNLSKSEAVQRLADLVIEGGLSIDLVHLEVILSNQIVSVHDLLKRPNWNNPDEKYKLLTLNQALTNNPSIIISLLYKNLKKVLYHPLSYSKTGPSYFDLFYMEQPQVYMNDELLDDDVDIKDPEKFMMMAKIVEEKKEVKPMAKLIDKS